MVFIDVIGLLMCILYFVRLIDIQDDKNWAIIIIITISTYWNYKFNIFIQITIHNIYVKMIVKIIITIEAVFAITFGFLDCQLKYFSILLNYHY